MANPTYKICPRCGEKRLLAGRQAAYNAKSSLDGLRICTECKTNEIYNIMYSKVNR